MLAEARKRCSHQPNFVIKIRQPRQVSRQPGSWRQRNQDQCDPGISPAILPARPFTVRIPVHWLEGSQREDCKTYIQNIVDIYKNYGFYGKARSSALQSGHQKQIVDCAVAGADIITTGLAVYRDTMKHAYTNQESAPSLMHGIIRLQNKGAGQI